MSETENKRRSSQDSKSRRGEVRSDVRSDGRSDVRSNGRTSSTYSSKRSTSSYGGTISDIETDYHKIAKKLAKDKEKLKVKLNKLIDDFDKQSEEHRRELEKSQDYFQEQINDLVEERDRTQDSLEEMRNSIIDDKEKIRQNFEQKLLKHKEALEKRYGSKDSQVVKRLENTIVTLQDRLTQQLEERERGKDTLEQYYTEREETMRKNISDLEEQLRKIKESSVKDRLELQKTAKSFNDEKEFMLTRLRKEKDDEIASVISEKNAACVSVQSLKDQIEKRSKALDLQRDEEITKMKFEFAETKRSYESKFSEANISFKNSISDLERQYEGKLYTQDQQFKNELERLSKEYEKNLYNVSGESSRKVEQIITDTRNQIEEQKNTIIKLSRDLENNPKHIEHKYEQVLQDLSCKYETKEREVKELYLRHEKTVGELNDTNTRLKEQIQTLKDNLKKVQDNSQNVNGQMITTFTKQREQLDKEISTKDSLIEKLERQLKKVSEESIDRLNTIERKLKNTNDDITDITHKYSSSKLALEKKEKEFSLLKDEISKVKESNDLTVEKLRKSFFEKELLETKVKTFEDLSKTKEAYADSERNKAAQLHILSQSLQNKIKEMELELDRKDKSNKSLLFEVDATSKSLSTTIAENNKIKNQMTDDFRRNLSSIQLEKDKQIEEMKKSSSQLENSYKIQISHKEKEVENLRLQFSETMRKEIGRVSLEKDKQIEEYKKRIETLEKDITRQVEQSIKNINIAREDQRKDFQNTIIDKEKQIDELQKKISQMDSIIINQEQTKIRLTESWQIDKREKEELIKLRQDFSDQHSKLEKLQLSFQESKSQFQESLNKTKTDHALELQKLNIKLQETSKLLQAAEDLTDKTKAAYANFLETEGKKYGPEVKAKLIDLEKERNSLLSQLASSDKKLQQLQYDIASATATIRVKSQSLDERETNIRKLEESIRLAPPKLLDPSIKKSRDDALIHLRQSKLELSQLKEEIITMNQKLQIAENTISDIEKEKSLILKSQAEIKETFVNNLNQQQEHHQKELQDKNARIKDLENILLETIADKLNQSVTSTPAVKEQTPSAN